MNKYIQKQISTQSHEQWFSEQVSQGVESANTGNLISNDLVVEIFAKRKEQTKKNIAVLTDKK